MSESICRQDEPHADDSESVNNQIEAEASSSSNTSSRKKLKGKKKKKKSKPSVPIPDEIAGDLELRKYWYQRYRIFRRFDQGIKLDRGKMCL